MLLCDEAGAPFDKFCPYFWHFPPFLLSKIGLLEINQPISTLQSTDIYRIFIFQNCDTVLNANLEIFMVGNLLYRTANVKSIVRALYFHYNRGVCPVGTSTVRTRKFCLLFSRKKKFPSQRDPIKKLLCLERERARSTRKPNIREKCDS